MNTIFDLDIQLARIQLRQEERKTRRREEEEGEKRMKRQKQEEDIGHQIIQEYTFFPVFCIRKRFRTLVFLILIIRSDNFS